MNIVLWILQAVLALHTVAGAAWKFANSEQTVPELKMIPHGVWLALSVPEALFAAGLLLPALGKRFGLLAPAAAACLAVEMLAFCAINLSSSTPNNGHAVYWLAVTGVCAFIVYGRVALRPF